MGISLFKKKIFFRIDAGAEQIFHRRIGGTSVKTVGLHMSPAEAGTWHKKKKKKNNWKTGSCPCALYNISQWIFDIYMKHC